MEKTEATPKKKRGRSKGSKNRDKSQVELTEELKRIQKMIKKQLDMLKNLVAVRYLALDGHFGNNNTLHPTDGSPMWLASHLQAAL